MENRVNEKASSLRWKILRRAPLRHRSHSNPDDQSQMDTKRIYRRTIHGINLIPSHVLDECETNNCDISRDSGVWYTLPIHGAPKLFSTGVARIVKLLFQNQHPLRLYFSVLKEAIHMFLEVVKENGLHFSVAENYDIEIWKLHEKDHCYPFLIRITESLNEYRYQLLLLLP